MSYPNNQLIEGATESNLSKIKTAISRGAYDWNNALIQSCKNGSLLITIFLLEQATHSFVCWQLLFYHACKNGHQHIVELIFKQARDKICLNSGLSVACESGNVQLVDMLVNHGSNNWNDGLYGASVGGHLQLVTYMIKLGANMFDYALRGAVRANQHSVILFLIELGSDIDLAVLDQQDIEYLVKKQPSINFRDYRVAANKILAKQPLIKTILDELLPSDLSHLITHY